MQIWAYTAMNENIYLGQMCWIPVKGWQTFTDAKLEYISIWYIFNLSEQKVSLLNMLCLNKWDSINFTNKLNTDLICFVLTKVK